MDDAETAARLEALVAQSASVLLTRGLIVEIAAVRGTVDHLVDRVAREAGLGRDDALHFVTPEVVADAIVRAADQDDHAAAVRPVRKRDEAVVVPPWVSGRLVMALAKVAQWAGVNGAERDQHHAFDLSVELGDSLLQSRTSGLMEIHLDLLAEMADLAERSAARIEAGQWVECSCGERHSDAEAPLAVVAAMRSDAELARRLSEKADGA
ncbi:hypothetical protein [Kitasatospora sp. NPDC098663]|uniref:hypothetical protein n=1 Tax=Kitasatospora sp. NPDC098663 TaxID=3364096 RepID=UPI003817EEA2